MNEFIVNVDRRAGQLRVRGNRIFLPYLRDGELWNDLQRPVLATPTGQLTPEALDLIDFTTAIFHLDKLCPRGEREQWIRKIHINISLRNPDRFLQIEENVRWALTLLGGDNFSFDVSRFNELPRAPIRVSKKVREWGQITDVALLSGGQDSFAGAAQLMANTNCRPLMVRVNTRDKANLTDVVARFRQHFGREPAFYSQTAASPVDPDQDPKLREPTQRLRSFYFLGIGSALAAAHGVNNVYINENGIMAIHLPMDAARSSTFSTRTAYPQFLNLFQGIVRHWLGNQIEIRNPFALSTKTEVLEVCARLGIGPSLYHTVSCAHSASIQQTVKRQGSKDYLMAAEAPDLHCGYCFPCLLRRVSMWKSGLAEYDVEYATNPFKVFVDGSSDKYDFVYEASSAVIGLLRLTKKFEDPDIVEALSEYPQIAECAAVLGDGSLAAIVDLHRRFAADVKEYVQENASYLNFFFDATRSNQLETQVAAIASDQMIDAILQRRGARGSEAFYGQIHRLFDIVRLRVQVALAQGALTPAQIERMLDDAAGSAVGRRRPPVELKNKEGIEIREETLEKVKLCNCPPFTEV